MSYVVALPEMMSAATIDIASIGSSVATANQGVEGAITSVLAAAEDEVSAAIAALFSAHGQGYQALSAQTASFYERFVQALTGAAGAYAAAEAASVSALEAVELVVQQILQAPTNLAAGSARVANTVGTASSGAAGTVTDIPSLANRLQSAALWPVKHLLSWSALVAPLAAANDPLAAANNALWQLLETPPLAWYIGNAPSPYLTWFMGQTVQYGTYDGMRVVQITPAYSSGEYVIAMHGGGFILPPSIFHWIHYSVTANMTGATVQVPIYPLVWQGGTAGDVVPRMAGLISSQIAQHGAANVSVIGDSAGGNLALAATQFMVSQGDPVPSRMVLLSPWLDVGNPWQDVFSVQLAKMWAGNLPVNNYLVSPLYGSLSGLPPTYVYSGSWDPLETQAALLQRAAISQGAPFSFVLANFQVHDWVLFTPGGSLYWPQINQQLGIAA